MFGIANGSSHLTGEVNRAGRSPGITHEVRMNKAELIDEITAHADMTKAEAGRALDAFVSTVTTALARDEDVSLVGFGTFSVKERAARPGRNPATGAEIQIAASKVPAFKPGKGLKEAL